MATAVKAGFALHSDNVGLARVEASPAGSAEVVNDLLQKNHEKWHMYFRDVAGHNHIPHAVLSTLAMGGGPQELRRAYDDGEDIQRPMPPVDPQAVKEMSNPAKFRERMQTLDEYPNFLTFFKNEIAANNGNWQDVVKTHCFARTELADLMLAQLFEGLYHPIIHMGFGVEFELAPLVAEGLAQAASHDPMYIDVFFQKAEQLAASGTIPPAPLAALYREARTTDAIRTAARLPDGPWKVRDGVLGRAMEPVVQLAARFQVPATEPAIERATAEMISCAAWACAAAHQPGKQRKIDFFMMHAVTSSIFVSVLNRQGWLRLEDKARVVEWKTRLDLVWYAASAAPELREEYMTAYEPTLSKGMGWAELYRALNQHHDDGHVAKFVRAIKNGEEAARPFEEELEQLNGSAPADSLPVRGELWLKIAQMCYDSTVMYVDGQSKWVWGAGFPPMWDKVAAE
ncbi:uncharacterized protein B0H64DRAFT_45562 [Chaetomium fimeti]|uniref:Oxidoreductase AflY n=1 Tax=Chaetomium fimeti TaxID=1854472 RepID=A0AAE0H7T3_9PEZI|nr:hypothetical protein B0H64DRAFT_45562 [Chaetomium fimeti]